MKLRSIGQEIINKDAISFSILADSVTSNPQLYKYFVCIDNTT